MSEKAFLKIVYLSPSKALPGNYRNTAVLTDSQTEDQMAVRALVGRRGGNAEASARTREGRKAFS